MEEELDDLTDLSSAYMSWYPKLDQTTRHIGGVNQHGVIFLIGREQNNKTPHASFVYIIGMSIVIW